MNEKAVQVPRIVVADDDPEILAMITRHLEARGAEVIECADGESTLELIQQTEPDLVLLDVMMPGMSGWEVCKAIREDPDLDATGVIMLTGIGERLNEMTSPIYGADDYLDKPFDFAELDEKINRVVTERAAKLEQDGAADTAGSVEE